MKTRTSASFRRSRLPLVAFAVAAALTVAATGSAEVVEYYHLDALGTVRAVTSQTQQVLEQHAYMPFGEELCNGGPCPSGQPRRFTGKERDTETGLDYFGARYHAAAIGRFTTTDPVIVPTATLLDPQRWNRYAYVSNNPLARIDPDGRVWYWRPGEKPVWVSNNADGTAGPAPGEAHPANPWQAFSPSDSSNVKSVEYRDGFYTIGIDASGKPRASYALAGLQDRTVDFLWVTGGFGGAFARQAESASGNGLLALGRFGPEKPALEAMANKAGAKILDGNLGKGVALENALRQEIDSATGILFRMKGVVPGTIAHDVELAHILSSAEALAKTVFILH